MKLARIHDEVLVDTGADAGDTVTFVDFLGHVRVPVNLSMAIMGISTCQVLWSFSSFSGVPGGKDSNPTLAEALVAP